MRATALSRRTVRRTAPLAPSLLGSPAMTVSALVVTLSSDPCDREIAMSALRDDPRLTLGAGAGDRLPVVAETESAALGAELCEGLGARCGVVRVDVVAIDFSQDVA